MDSTTDLEEERDPLGLAEGVQSANTWLRYCTLKLGER